MSPPFNVRDPTGRLARFAQQEEERRLIAAALDEEGESPGRAPSGTYPKPDEEGRAADDMELAASDPYPPDFATWSQDQRKALPAEKAQHYREQKRGNGAALGNGTDTAPPAPNDVPPGEPVLAAPSAQFKSVKVFCDEYAPLSYAVELLIRSASLYTLTAKTGGAKTALLIMMALAIATGRNGILGREVTRGRVAYIAAENSDDLRMRIPFGTDLPSPV
jgi:hypothetical protein